MRPSFTFGLVKLIKSSSRVCLYTSDSERLEDSMRHTLDKIRRYFADAVYVQYMIVGYKGNTIQ